MDSVELIIKLWPLFLSFLGGLAWIIKLETNQSHHQKEFDKLKNEIESFKKEAAFRNQIVQEKFDEVHLMFMGIKEQLARIEGYMSSSNNKK